MMNTTINLNVTDNLEVSVIQSQKHGFLMDTNSVALGYGVSPNTIRSNKSNNKQEFHENQHFIYGVQNLNSAEMKKLFWTKKGIIRLGFFIKSGRAKEFRNWAEGIVFEISTPEARLPKPKKRRHNRLTPTRLNEIASVLIKVENTETRLQLAELLGLS